MGTPLWDFWIDVGGTFTDCLARAPDGSVRRHKVLSSGVVRGSAAECSQQGRIVDPARRNDPPGFWNGAKLTILDADGEPVDRVRIKTFDRREAALELQPPPSTPLAAGTRYELDHELDAPILAIRYLLGLQPQESTPPIRLRLGTTRGTNALLTRSGATTALVTTRGFGDVLEIGYQQRPRLFDLTIRKSPPLYRHVVEIDERVAADGTVLTPLDEPSVQRQLSRLHEYKVESLAICLLHADLYPRHEAEVERIARRLGFHEISRSSAVAPMIKIVSRGDTTVADAYLNPVLRRYFDQLTESLPGSEIRLMTSAGGLATPRNFCGHQSLLSGPAGGVVGYARTAEAAGVNQVIGFDMGGTSTDVSRYDGEYQYQYETTKAGIRITSPTLAIETVAAGGGSVCRFDGVKLVVGPESSGANPGPACYGRGGPLSVTDLNLYLGHVPDELFPFRLDRAAVERRLDRLAEEVAQATGEQVARDDLAVGLLQIANANMAGAIRNVTVAQGYDPAEYTLAAFGGAAAQHACAVASEIGVQSILLHPDAGILSAYGLGAADMTLHGAAGVYEPLAEIRADHLRRLFDSLSRPLVQELTAAGVAADKVEVRPSLDLRYRGVEEGLNLHFDQGAGLRERFEVAHERQYGYVQTRRDVEVAVARVEVVGRSSHTVPKSRRAPRHLHRGERTAIAWFGGKWMDAPVFHRGELQPGSRVDGPAIVLEQHSTLVVDPGWQAEMLTGGELLLNRASVQPSAADALQPAPEAVLVEIFNNLLAGIAERMGHVLRRTAGSVNVKERLDYSCAVFTADGDLVANAPHVPVHLGAMGETVRCTLQENPSLRAGDVVITNDPYRGGSHLPDITAVAPVHVAGDSRRVFCVACRAHHAEIGGVRPGSMPPMSQRLGEEGVVISNFALVRDGEFREDEIRALLNDGQFPSRAVDENVADLQSQVAALQQGVRDLQQLIEKYGIDAVRRQTRAVQLAAETKIRQALAKLEPGRRSFVDFIVTIEGRSVPIRLTLDILEDATSVDPAAVFDFTGTGGVVEGNLNANPAIVRAAVLYVLRLLVDEDIPLNEGALRAVRIVLPRGLLNPQPADPPRDSPAVAAGNVETSQRIVDVLLGGLGIAAASQGTMNNLLFGNSSFGCYETICGGSGATVEGPGADAVQVHMTNTRATDPEVLERRHPVRLREFRVRRGSGGKGRNRGGDGAVREIEFLAPLQVSLITQRRGPHPPYGAAGGAPGALGENELVRASGEHEHLPSICQLDVSTGDRLIVRTPGGGGWGEPQA